MCIPQEYKVVWHDVLTNLLSLFCTCYLLFITFSMSHDTFHGWVTLDTDFSAHWPSHSSVQFSQFYATQLKNRSILCYPAFLFPFSMYTVSYLYAKAGEVRINCPPPWKPRTNKVKIMTSKVWRYQKGNQRWKKDKQSSGQKKRTKEQWFTKHYTEN
jgi:hypothetical protein